MVRSLARARTVAAWLRAAGALAVAAVLVTPLAAQEAPPPDEAALVDLIAKMSLEEKVGQLNLRGSGSTGSQRETPAEVERAVRAGEVGAFLNVMRVEAVDRLQRIAVEESPHGIPLLFGRDVVHGLHAVAPIPLGQAATWNLPLVEAGARAAATDATAYGIRWTYSPMVDVARDPRWGRIAEGFGEDPFLASEMAAAMVRGYQGPALDDPTAVAACVKHFAAYGAAEGGRDYGTVSISESDLRNVYLPPFHAAVRAGAASLMTAFNELDGIPATANRRLLTEILKDEWGFDGFVVSDWTSVAEMIAHGSAADLRDAARQAALAGLDMEMTSDGFARHLAELVRSGEVPEAVVDAAVLRVLRVKQRLGLFARPYRRAVEEPGRLDPASVELARRLALQSVVLLRNERREGPPAAGSPAAAGPPRPVLPLAADVGKVAVVGPLADAPHEQLGTWAFDGRKEDAVTPLAALRAALGPERVAFAAGLTHSRASSREGFAAALAAAEAADVVLFFGGEEAILSGEAHSRAEIDLPGAQPELIRALAATGKPLVLVILAGRPVTLEGVLDQVDAVLMAWHPGIQGGPALADLLLGRESPAGRLPVTWPKAVGQVPIYYNHKSTGRPPQRERMIPFEEIPVGAWQSSLGNTSHYLDLGMDPEFPFGFGLTYSTFRYSDLVVSPEVAVAGEPIRVAATLTNTGPRAATEVVQLYVRDVVGSRTRPVRELAGFRRVELPPGGSLRVELELGPEDLAFFDGETWRTEPGDFEVWIAPDAASGLRGTFRVPPEALTP
jgi:beta-glucosidase